MATPTATTGKIKRTVIESTTTTPILVNHRVVRGWVRFLRGHKASTTAIIANTLANTASLMVVSLKYSNSIGLYQARCVSII